MKIAKRIRRIWLTLCAGTYRFRRRPSLTVSALKQRLNAGKDMLVLDVRTAKEYEGEYGHLDVALNIPVEQLLKRIHELDDYIQRPIAIVCHTDKRSEKAARLLSKFGFTNIRVVRGGMTFWNDYEFPVERLKERL